jgi:hypothetical protein
MGSVACDRYVTLKSRNAAMTIDLFEQLERHASARPGDVALRTLSGMSTDSITFHELIDGAAR